MTRDKIIIKTSIIGILANVFLAGFKAAVGILSSSVAVVMDAVNNLSDALSSIITIVGTKLANKPADKKHPLGYGRIEFISAAVIALIVLYAGVTSFVESVKKIIHPITPDYSTAALVIIIVGIIVKVVLGSYVKGVGNKVNSDSLINSGQDALLDSIISTSTLIAAIIYIFTKVSLEAWLGAIISLVIIKSGFDMIRDAGSQILGERVPDEVAKKVKASICELDEIRGAYDLVLHSYGPDKLEGSVHIEIPDTMTADRIDALERKVQEKVFVETGIILTGISIYSMNTKNDEAADIYKKVAKLVKSVDHVKQIHGFYVDLESKDMRFDVVITFDANDIKAQHQKVIDTVTEEFSDYDLRVSLDTDVSD
ncbi:MAG: cation diffusion facilitator family transporter [Lachnospiraceae bacterium]|nr:cation diffusion facilitator family transporter [Lachnospiraceae bacterium]